MQDSPFGAIIPTLPLIAIMISLGGQALQYFLFLSGLRDRISKNEEAVKPLSAIAEDLEELKEKVTSLSVKADLFWGMVQEHMSKMLLHPDDITRDVLLIKFKNSEMSLEEMYSLKHLLEVDLEHPQDVAPAQRMATMFVLNRLEQMIRGVD